MTSKILPEVPGLQTAPRKPSLFRHCIIPHCQLSRYSATYHRVPSNKAKRARWSKALQMDLQDSIGTPRKALVCSGHFTKEDFQRDLRAELLGTKAKVRLKDTAVPSQFITREENQKVLVVDKRGRPRLYQQENALQKGVLQALDRVPSLEPVPSEELQNFVEPTQPYEDLASLPKTNPLADEEGSGSNAFKKPCQNSDCNLEKMKLKEENRQLKSKLAMLEQAMEEQQNSIIDYLKETGKMERDKNNQQTQLHNMSNPKDALQASVSKNSDNSGEPTQPSLERFEKDLASRIDKVISDNQSLLLNSYQDIK